MPESFLGSDTSWELAASGEVPLPGEVGKEDQSSSQRSLVLSGVWKSFAIPQSKAEV